MEALYQVCQPRISIDLALPGSMAADPKGYMAADPTAVARNQVSLHSFRAAHRFNCFSLLYRWARAQSVAKRALARSVHTKDRSSCERLRTTLVARPSTVRRKSCTLRTEVFTSPVWCLSSTTSTCFRPSLQHPLRTPLLQLRSALNQCTETNILQYNQCRAWYSRFKLMASCKLRHLAGCLIDKSQAASVLGAIVVVAHRLCGCSLLEA